MDKTGANTFEGEIVAILRSKCIGFQRDGEQLVSVLESLVRPKDGPPTVVYQLRRSDGTQVAVLRRRPPIDIPAPAPYME